MGPPLYQANMLPTELSWLGFFCCKLCLDTFLEYHFYYYKIVYFTKKNENPKFKSISKYLIGLEAVKNPKTPISVKKCVFFRKIHFIVNLWVYIIEILLLCAIWPFTIILIRVILLLYFDMFSTFTLSFQREIVSYSLFYIRFKCHLTSCILFACLLL